MNNLGKIVGVNLLILFIYMLWIILSNAGPEAALGIVILAAMCIVVHVVLNFIIAIYYFIKGNKPTGKAFFLSAGLVLVIGFSSCLGSASLT